MTYSFISRSRITISVIIVFSLILITKLFLVQIVHNNTYSQLADRQYVTSSLNIYERGTIFFQNQSGGDGQLIAAATQATGFKIAIDPSKIIDAESIYQKLAKIITLNHDDFIARATKANDPYEEVAHHLTKEEADAVSAFKITGLSVFEEKWRFYPGGTLASHVLGLVGYKGTELGGRYGLERQYNSELTRNSDNPYVNFSLKFFLIYIKNYLKIILKREI